MTLLATTTATNIVLGILAFNLLVAAFLYVQDVRDLHKFPDRYLREQTYVPREWVLPEQDEDDIDLQVWR